ncbi:MAG: hypothetical protein Q7R82_00230 [Candidatus Daviesbacteria bacterium]|nr:hypothetical protein [Candidatus Daviesbacteria bacterium]
MNEISAEGVVRFPGAVKEPSGFRRAVGGAGNKVAAVGRWFWEGIKTEPSKVKPKDINVVTTAETIDRFVLDSSLNRLNGPGDRTNREFSLATVGMNMGMYRRFGDKYDYRAEFSKETKDGINPYQSLRKSLDSLVRTGVLESNLHEVSDNFGEDIYYKVKDEEMLRKIRIGDIKVEELL